MHICDRASHGADALTIVAMLFAPLLLAAYSSGSAPAPIAASSDWTIAYSPGMPSQMTKKDGHHYFDFPNVDGVHYVYKRTPSVNVGQTVTMVFTIEGSGNFVPTEGTASARVRLFMQEQGDSLTAAEQYKRWWSTAAVELKPGTFTLTTVIAPEFWSSSWARMAVRSPVNSTTRYPNPLMSASRSAAPSPVMASMWSAGVRSSS